MSMNFDEGVPSFEDTIKQITEITRQSQEAPQEPEPVTAEAAPAPAESAQSEPVGVPDLPPSGNNGQAPEPDKAPGAAPSRQEMISARLRQIMEREAALIAKEKELEAKQPKAAPSQELSLSQLRAMYQRDPVAALKALDEQFQPGTLAKQLWYHDLGELAPKEASAELRARQALATAEQLQRELEERDQRLRQEWEQQKAEQAYHQYVGAVEAYTRTLPDSTPLVKKFAEKKPDKVVQALVGVARKHAQATNGQVLTPEQAAAKLEASLKELQFVDPAPSTQTQPATQTSAPETPNTLRNKHTSVQPSKVTDDDLDDEVLRQRAMAAIERLKRQATAE